MNSFFSHPANPGTRFLAPVSIISGLLALAAPLQTQADERVFTYSYEAVSILPKEGLEFEQWITYRGGKEDGVFSAWDIREEIEYGVTDRYTTALYLNFESEHSDGVPGHDDGSEFHFEGISSEHKYQLINPHTNPIGVLLYGEGTTNGEELELEEKLILQKYFGEKWNAAINLILEEEWEFESEATTEELAVEVTAGLSYQLSPHWAVGLEGMHHRGFTNISFSHQSSSAFFVGPNVHYGTSTWWTTLTVMPQVGGSPDTGDSSLNLDDEERVQVRLIAGFNF